MKMTFTYITCSALLLFACTKGLPVPRSTNGVILTADLDPPLASPLQLVTFRCNITDSSILEWHSLEYIGVNELQILSHSGAPTSVTSATNPSTTATRLSDSGSSTIVSELRITASTQYPVSSVTCVNAALGSNMTISLYTFEKYVTLIPETVIAYPEQLIVFTCTTRASSILEWESEEYIGAESLQILSHNSSKNVTFSVDNPTYATRVSSTIENGLPLIVSQLHIMVISSLDSTASVTCRNAATRAIETVIVQVDKQSSGPTTSVPNTNSTSSVDKTSTTAVADASVDISTYIVVVVTVLVLLLLPLIISALLCISFKKYHHQKPPALPSPSVPVKDDVAWAVHIKPESPKSDSSASDSPRESVDSGDMLL